MGRFNQAYGTVAVKDISARHFVDPPQQCDIVMKGGITSGIVYPPAILRIAQQYRFRGIGGTSAGAIAAAVAAAAEYYRQRNPGERCGDGFMKIKTNIMTWLGTGSNLRSLFVPTILAEPLYRTFLWLVGLSSALRRRTLVGVLNLVITAVLLIATVTGVVAAFWPWPLGHAWFIVKDLALAVSLVGAIEIAIFAFVLPKTNCGMCTGGRAGTMLALLPWSRVEPLTWWLSRHIDDIAGKTGGTPLTFEDLKACGVELRMITTCLTMARPYSLPFAQNLFYYRPDELEAYFPKNVVAWMQNNERKPTAPREIRDVYDILEYEQSVARHAYLKSRGFWAMPVGTKMPVVVAARLSLSFPFLLSAVKLYAVDRSLRSYKRNPSRPEPEPVWFSDGGLSSNFPISMFDEPLPKWPTMAITLEDFPPGSKENVADEQVFLPAENKEGIGSAWTRLASRGQRWPKTGAFYAAMVNTMQNWQDSLQSEAPGFRDRIAHVRLSSDQGGLNLTMPQATIDALFERGELAGADLAEQFRIPIPPDRTMTWDNHRWIRFRTTMDVMERYAQLFASGWNAPSTGCDTYPGLLARGYTTIPSYKLQAGQGAASQATVTSLETMAQQLAPKTSTLTTGAPRPISDLRTRPRY